MTPPIFYHMLDIHTILSINPSTPKSELQRKYRKKLFTLHPSNRETGNAAAFIELEEAYKLYLSGDAFPNCWAVVDNTASSAECRCGGIYEICSGFVGRIECEFCSCFIEVEEPPLHIIGGDCIS